MCATRRVLAAGLATLLALTGGVPGNAQEPRFRGGTNLVRLDVYVSANGVAVTDLTADDFDVLEDNAPQTVTSFELVQARGAVPDSARRESNTVAESRERAARPGARAFVLYLDTLHVQTEGSYRAANPVATMLDRVIGADDLVGVMTPEMAPRNMTFSPLTTPVGEMLRTNWTWGERGAVAPTDPRENDLRLCYPENGETAGFASAVIERRRERKVLQSLDDLLEHLEGLRDERTFVLLLTEGWTLPGADERLGAPIGNAPPPGGPEAIGAVNGRLTTGGAATPMLSWCERERSLVGLTDLSMEFRQLMQRANRANVSFYPIDPRGLVAFDDPIGPARPSSPSADRARLGERQSSMRRIADETDGIAVVNTNIDKALPRLLTDIGSYYLLGYTSTNARLDGRYRRLTVRVKRPGVEVRARPGYLAPSAAEMTAAQGTSSSASRTSATPAGVSEALSRLPVSRRPASVHLLAAGAAGRMAVTVELDRTIAALPEWAKGARVVVAVDPADRGAGTRAHVTEMLAPGARVQSVRLPDGDGPIVAGRYQVRVEVLAEGARTPVVVSTLVEVPGEKSLLGSGILVSRRGPGTGRIFEPTADARFRRTERLQAEVARLDPAAVVTARLLNRTGQVMQIPIATTDRPGADNAAPAVLADVPLAPLAAGEYVLELVANVGDRSETRSYAIRMIP